MTRFFATIIAGCFTITSYGQATIQYAEKLRVKSKIPELAYAVVSADSVLELQVLGVQRVNTKYEAKTDDRFRIGSNTKAITGYLAAQLVKQGKIKWDTKFFDLYPELKAGSNKAYHDLTLINLLSFRTRLFPYTYTYAEPTKEQFKGNADEQRYRFTEWFFKHGPEVGNDSIHFSNLGYIAAGLMLEKATGKTYKELVADLGKQLGISFGFGQPNTADSLQPWGHDAQLKPEPPGDNYKLNWLLPAGNINCNLPDYVKFIQLQLKGLSGRDGLLSKQEFEFLHFGLGRFAVGWFWDIDERKQLYSYNVGNPGTFLTKVYVYPGQDRAYIVFANVQTDAADAGIDLLSEELKKEYSRTIK